MPPGATDIRRHPTGMGDWLDVAAPIDSHRVPPTLRQTLQRRRDALPWQRVFGAWGSAPPVPRSRISGYPRLVCAIQGRNAMLIPQGTTIERVDVRPGMAVFIPAHAWNCTLDENPLTFCTLHFGPSRTRYYLRRHDRRDRVIGAQHCGFYRSGPPSSAIAALLASAETLADGDPTILADVVAALLRQAVAELVEPPVADVRERNTWEQLCDIFSEHVDDPDFDRSRAAAAIGVHPNHLARLVRREVGTGFNAWVRNLRGERRHTPL